MNRSRFSLFPRCRRLLWLALSCAGICFQLRAADGRPPEKSPAAASPLAELPFEQIKHWICIEARVNGSRPLRILLHNGGELSGLGKLQAAELGLLASARRFKHRTDYGWREEWKLSGLQFDLNGFKFAPRGGRTGVLPDSDPPIDGVLGQELFEQFVVELDFSARKLRLYDPRAYRPPARLTAIPFKLKHDLPLVRGLVPNGSGSNVPVEMYVNTTLPVPLFMGLDFARSSGLYAAFVPAFNFRPDPHESALFHYGDLPRVQLGPVTADHTDLILADAPGNEIGSLFLQRFNVVFDYSHRRLLVESNANFSATAYPRISLETSFVYRSEDEFLIHLCGAVLSARGPPFQEFQVINVERNTAASRAGLQKSDRLSTVNGKPPSALSLLDWMKITGTIGSTNQLELIRDGENLKAELKSMWPDNL